MSNLSDIVILSDLYGWNAPLVERLTNRGARVNFAESPERAAPSGILLNRVSAKKATENLAYSERVESFLAEQERSGRRVINGAICHRLGFDKMAQAALFDRCGAKTPLTQPLRPGERALPHLDVLLKPLAGSYGQGILSLEAGAPIPPHLASSAGSFIEQERVVPGDEAIHRVEVLGGDILYEAVTPLRAGEFDYCLASGEFDTRLSVHLDQRLEATVLEIARQAGMSIGSVEYLLGPHGEPFFIDLNPVSSFHPGVGEQLGFDPMDQVAEWLWPSPTDEESD